MKHNTITLIALFWGLTFFGCKKQEQETLTPKIKNDKVTTTATTATFTWTVDWPGKLISVVEVSENEDMSHSQTYGSETETENHNFTVTATDLKVATKYYYRYLVWNKFYVDNKFVMEGKSFNTTTDMPKVKTVEVTDVTRTSATVIGEVIDECGAEVTERGVCWSTNHNPTTSGSHLSSGTGLGTYSIALTNLVVGKTYYVRSYAKNSKGTAYSDDELSFTTGDAVKPTVTTAEITNIDWRTATGGGEVTDDGGATVTERGICWSTSHNPEVSGDHANSGTGTGNYTVNITGLTAGTTYYVRAYAKNIAGLNYGNEVSFETKAPELSTVTTNSVTDISWTMATGGGNVTSDGGTDVIERGICWGIAHNPDTGNNFSHLAASSGGIGSYLVNITGLTAGTTYYVRAYATNSKGTSYGEEKEFTTQALQKPTVTTVSVNQLNFTNATAVGGGNVTSDGGDAVTERGIYYGTFPNPATTGTKLLASSTGTGTFTCTIYGLVEGTTYYVCAYAINGQGIGFGSEKSFSFERVVPTGAINGIFSVSSSEKVYFSQGNLQYRASDGRWRFAEHQWNFVGTQIGEEIGGNVIGSDNSYISSSYNGWIDLFGWATSGYNYGSYFCQPWSTSQTSSDYYAYGNYQYNLFDQTGQADWGVHNAIYNGGNVAGQWRTLTKEEWVYIFNLRTNATSKYGCGNVNGVNGIILLPDSWTLPSGLSFISGNSSWSNTYTTDQWSQMEANGAVFLPAAGRREEISVYWVGTNGFYWSASRQDGLYAYSMHFGDDYLNASNGIFRSSGYSVRLVTPAEN